MAPMDDYGYLPEEEQSKISYIAKKSFLIGAVLFSLLCFFYITINAYHFVYNDNENGGIKTIKSPQNDIKIAKNSQNNGITIKDMDKTVYQNIVGNNGHFSKKTEEKIIKIPKTVENDLKKGEKTAIDSHILSNLEVDEEENDEKSVKNDVKTANLDKIDAKTVQNGQKTAQSDEKDAKKSKKEQIVAKYRNKVQLAAMNSQNAADRYWNNLQDNYPRLFADLKPFVQEVDLGKRGVFFRLQVGNFKNQIKAEEFCVKFIVQAQKSKSDCIVVE